MPYVNFFQSFADLAFQLAKFTDNGYDSPSGSSGGSGSGQTGRGQAVVDRLTKQGSRQRRWFSRNVVAQTAAKYRVALSWLFGQAELVAGVGG